MHHYQIKILERAILNSKNLAAVSFPLATTDCLILSRWAMLTTLTFLTEFLLSIFTKGLNELLKNIDTLGPGGKTIGVIISTVSMLCSLVATLYSWNKHIKERTTRRLTLNADGNLRSNNSFTDQQGDPFNISGFTFDGSNKSSLSSPSTESTDNPLHQKPDGKSVAAMNDANGAGLLVATKKRAEAKHDEYTSPIKPFDPSCV